MPKSIDESQEGRFSLLPVSFPHISYLLAVYRSSPANSGEREPTTKKQLTTCEWDHYAIGSEEKNACHTHTVFFPLAATFSMAIVKERLGVKLIRTWISLVYKYGFFYWLTLVGCVVINIGRFDRINNNNKKTLEGNFFVFFIGRHY